MISTEEMGVADGIRLPEMSSSRPDAKVLLQLALVRNFLLAFVALVAVLIVAAWLIPSIGNLLPDGWALMKFNTAGCMLLAVVSLMMSRPEQTSSQLMWSRTIACIVLLVAGSTFLEHLTGRTTGLDTLLVSDHSPQHPGRMSLQTSIFLVALACLIIGARARKSLVSNLADFLALCLMMLVLVIFAGYCFGAAQLFGQSDYTRTSPQTLLCMIFLTLVIVGRRADYGYYSVLVGVGIGSRVARIMLPIAVMVPFMLVIVGAYATLAGWLSAPYAAALTAATTSTLLFCMVIALAWRINDLERDLRDMSITDDLTQIYNRRGFQLLGEQALLEARRGESPLAILYFDLDGLKLTNDTYGHDVGSQFVKDMAALLKSIFRGADIIARVGGDEFAVVAHADSSGLHTAMARLTEAADAFNGMAGRQYQIRYSVGEAFCNLAFDEPFAAIVNRADPLMYERKRAKRANRA